MGSNNRYDGIDEYAVEVIKYRAVTLIGTAGYTRDDVEDIEQDLILALLERMDHFDASKANCEKNLLVTPNSLTRTFL
ncbi:hypothetical protein GF324_09625 [bacterium]|nr:hypothetical protein [bacterium]